MKRFLLPLAIMSLWLGACGAAPDDVATSDMVAQTPVKPPSQAEENNFVVTILGSGTPVPSATQYGASILVQINGRPFVFDCGRGCTSRLAQVNVNLLKDVEHLFVTHLHSDHIVGIPDLWLNGWTQERAGPLNVWGPRGTADMMSHLRSAFKADIAFRRADNLPAAGPGLDDAFTDMADTGGVIYDKDGIKITAFQVDHSHVKPAFGYMIEGNGRKVVISGDTTASVVLDKFAVGSDILFLEVMSPALVGVLERKFKPEQVARVLAYHLNTSQAATVFQNAQPKLGVYYHTINDGPFRTSLLTETREIYSGPLEVGEDLMQFQMSGSEEPIKIVRN